MKKVIVLIFALGLILNTNAQFINFGIKGGLNYNSNGDLKNDINSIKIGSDNDTGFHIGAFAEIDLPLALYLRPELLYTKTQSGYDKQGDLSINKIDAPILLGLKFLKIGRVFVGPSFQYIIDADFKNSDIYNDIRKDGVDSFYMGMQFGAGVELGKLGFDLRWERGLTDTEAKYIVGDNSPLQTITIDTRPQQFILSAYYKFK